MERTNRLIDCYLPPGEGFVLESMVATTYQVDFEFVEEDLLPIALGVRAPLSRVKAFRLELERKLQNVEVSLLYDLRGCDRLARLSPRIDALPIVSRKLHSKISLLTWVRENRPSGSPPDRRLRLIVGSANLTRQGFRHNYECVASLDFGGKSTSPRSLMVKAIGLVREIGAESKSPQLARQLAALSAHTALLPEGTKGPDKPVTLVTASEVVPALRESWEAMSSKPPETVTVVSPFWTEGSTAAEALFGLLQQLGSPSNVELVCRGEKSSDGKTWLPVFDRAVASDLKHRLSGRLHLRATVPANGTQDAPETAGDIGDETEEREIAAHLSTEKATPSEVQRPLHAKLILLDGKEGSVLYAGSSNCTRRGLGLGGPANAEAGFVYQIKPSQRKQLAGLIAFAGPAIEVQPDKMPATVQPLSEGEASVPTFLEEIVASGSMVSVRFRDAIPDDLVLLMPIPTRDGDAGYWVLLRADDSGQTSPALHSVDLTTCPRCDEHLSPVTLKPDGQSIQPHVFVEARWQGHSAVFPVRFDDKARLPFLLMGRKPTEGEIIEYFLFGTEPNEGDEGGFTEVGNQGFKTDAPIDTRRILAYFVRQFVQAIPGIEAEILRAAYSRASLDAALRGPTSPLELAERAFASLTRPPSDGDPQKTPNAVGFQLTEVLAALLRGRSIVVDPDLQTCFDPVVGRCREILTILASQHAELRAESFLLYQARILGDSQ